MDDATRADMAAYTVENVEFVKGYIEDIPLPEAAVDVVISNCVINLAAGLASVRATKLEHLVRRHEGSPWSSGRDVPQDSHAPWWVL